MLEVPHDLNYLNHNGLLRGARSGDWLERLVAPNRNIFLTHPASTITRFEPPPTVH